jgi:hypothetical protein
MNELSSNFSISETNSLQIFKTSLELDMRSEEALLRSDSYSLAEALGYFNPEVIQSVSFNFRENQIENETPLDPKSVSDLALKRSLELKQLDLVIAASYTEKTSILWRWFDPNMDATWNMGFPLIPLHEAGESAIRALQIRREQLQATSIRRAYEAVRTFNTSLKTYRLAHKLLKSSELKLTEATIKLRGQGTLEGDSLNTQVSTYLNNFTQVQTALTNYRVSKAKIDRFLLQGYYTETFPLRKMD